MTTAKRFRRFHGLATLFWIAMLIPTVLYWKDSVTYLVFLSIYTVIVDHMGAWQTARLERHQEKGRAP